MVNLTDREINVLINKKKKANNNNKIKTFQTQKVVIKIFFAPQSIRGKSLPFLELSVLIVR